MSGTLGEVGELAALARILPRLGGGPGALVGPGDDAALLATPDGGVLLSTDAMVEGPDFRLAWSTPEELGRKAVATNLADVAAMGGRPTGLLIALAAPPATPVSFLEALADGVRGARDRLAPEAAVLGGDLTRSPVVVITVTVAGSLDGRAPVLRSGARPGDLIGYAGSLGLAAAALRLLFAAGEEDPAAVAELRGTRGPLLAEQLAPEPPIGAGPLAAEAGASAMLDVSDGLLRDADAIDRAAAVVAVASGLPRAESVAAVLGGGEDHGLLATFRDVVPAPFRRLGRVLDGPPEVRVGGVAQHDAGWDSFAD